MMNAAAATSLLDQVREERRKVERMRGELQHALAKIDGGAGLSNDLDGLLASFVALEKAIGAQPVYPHHLGRAISKAEDASAAGAEPASPDDLVKALAAMPEHERATLLIKVAQTQPGRLQ